jgi:hypothetical protein
VNTNDALYKPRLFVVFSCSRTPSSATNVRTELGAYPEFLSGGGGGADSVAICNLCMILKIML